VPGTPAARSSVSAQAISTNRQGKPSSTANNSPWRRYSPVAGRSSAPSAREVKTSTPDIAASPITIVM